MSHLTGETVYGAVWLSFWCSTRPLADTGTDQYYEWLHHNPDKVMQFVLISACVCRRLSWTPKTKGAARRRLVEFLVFNSVYWKKSAPSNGVNRVCLIPKSISEIFWTHSDKIWLNFGQFGCRQNYFLRHLKSVGSLILALFLASLNCPYGIVKMKNDFHW